MKKVMLILSLFFLNFLSFGQAGPLTGTLVLNKGDMNLKWGDSVKFLYKVKNSGTDPLKILNVVTSCECQGSSDNNIQTIQPGKYGEIIIYVHITKKQLLSDWEKGNGVIDYDRTVKIETNGKKPNYQLYTRGKFRVN